MYKILSFLLLLSLTFVSFGDYVVWDKNSKSFYLCTDFNEPQSGVAIDQSGIYNGIEFSVIGVNGDKQISVVNANVPNYFRTRWYVLDGNLYRSYQWVSINDDVHVSVYQRGKTYFYDYPEDGWKDGFIGFVLEVIPPQPPSWTIDFRTQAQE